MAHGYNQASDAYTRRASVHQAGGMEVYFSHPYLTGQIKGTYGVNTVLLSRSTELDSEFFRARPLVDASKMKVLVSGDTVGITNNINAGIADCRMLETTGSVYDEDPIACIQLIADVGDSVAGQIIVKKFVNGRKKQTIYTGVLIQTLPYEILAGNDVPTYEASFYLTDRIVSDTTSAQSALHIQASGNKNEISGVFSPFSLTRDGQSGIYNNAGSIGNGIEKTENPDLENYGNPNALPNENATNVIDNGKSTERLQG